MDVLVAETAYPEAVFTDIGAIVFFLKVTPWQVPDFDCAHYRDRLRVLHQRRDDHEVNDDNDSLHCYLPSQARVAGIRHVDLRGFREVARCYTKAPGIVTPEIVATRASASG
jgi:hypothetical protein